MKVLAPLFALFVFASAQEFQDLQLTIVSPTQGQQVPVGSNLTVQLETKVGFVSLFVAYSLNDSNWLIPSTHSQLFAPAGSSTYIVITMTPCPISPWLIYKGPDSSGVVIKSVKEQGILQFHNIHSSKSRERVILYCEVEEVLTRTWSSPPIVIYDIRDLPCVVMHSTSR